MKPRTLDRTVVIGSILYGVLNFIPVFLAFVGFAVAFAAIDDSGNTFITVTFFGGIILWFLIPIVAGYLVARTKTSQARRLGQSVDAKATATWGALTTALGQLPFALCALLLFSSSFSQTEDIGTSSPILLFAVAVPLVSGLLGGLGGAIFFWLHPQEQPQPAS